MCTVRLPRPLFPRRASSVLINTHTNRQTFLNYIDFNIFLLLYRTHPRPNRASNGSTCTMHSKISRDENFRIHESRRGKGQEGSLSCMLDSPNPDMQTLGEPDRQGPFSRDQTTVLGMFRIHCVVWKVCLVARH